MAVTLMEEVPIFIFFFAYFSGGKRFKASQVFPIQQSL